MNRSKRIFRCIERNLRGVVLCKDMLVVVPTEHILRGFLLEATTERNRVYLWRVVTPLYRPMGHVILSYSHRISNAGKELYIDGQAYEKSADAIRAIISDGHIEYLRGIQHPRDFLRHASWIGTGSPLLNRVDSALTHFLVGNVCQAVESLHALDTEVDQLEPRQQEYIGPLLKRVVREIDTCPAGLTALLGEWETQNVEALGMQRARPPLPARLV